MVDFNKLLPQARMIVFGVVCTLALIVFCLGCHLTSRLYGGYYGFSFYASFGPLAIATSLLTLLTLPVMYFLSVSRKGAFTSFVVVEVAWCWFLWIMWIATAGNTVWVNGFSGGLAAEAQVVEAFAFINWLALLFYTNTLFVVSIMSHHKGNSSVWTSSVREFDFNSATSKSAIPPVVSQSTGETKVAQPQYYPPQQPMGQQPLAPQGGYAPQAAYTPQHTGGSFPTSHGTAQQPPVAMV